MLIGVCGAVVIQEVGKGVVYPTCQSQLKDGRFTVLPVPMMGSEDRPHQLLQLRARLVLGLQQLVREEELEQSLGEHFAGLSLPANPGHISTLQDRNRWELLGRWVGGLQLVAACIIVYCCVLLVCLPGTRTPTTSLPW